MNENESSFSIAYAGVMTTQIGYESSSAYTEVAPLYGEVVRLLPFSQKNLRSMIWHKKPKKTGVGKAFLR
jgi:hypothetical protein